MEKCKEKKKQKVEYPRWTIFILNTNSGQVLSMQCVHTGEMTKYKSLSVVLIHIILLQQNPNGNGGARHRWKKNCLMGHILFFPVLTKRLSM